MTRFMAGSSLFAILALFAFVPSQIAAQTDPDPAAGVLPFSTHVSGPIDSVDLATLDILIKIPVRTKAGAIPFAYAVVGNSHAYTYTLTTPQGSQTLIGVAGLGMGYLQGFQGQLSMGAHLRGTLLDKLPLCGGEQNDEEILWSVIDSTGAAHLVGKTDQDGCDPLPQGADLPPLSVHGIIRQVS